jgi:hypothetical protein
VHDDVEAARLGDDALDGRVDRGLVGDVHLDRPQIDPVLPPVLAQRGDRGGVATGDVAHAGVDGVPRVGERPDGERPEPAGRAGDDDVLRGVLGHDPSPPQMIPPLA